MTNYYTVFEYVFICIYHSRAFIVVYHMTYYILDYIYLVFERTSQKQLHGWFKIMKPVVPKIVFFFEGFSARTCKHGEFAVDLIWSFLRFDSNMYFLGTYYSLTKKSFYHFHFSRYPADNNIMYVNVVLRVSYKSHVGDDDDNRHIG